MCLNDGGLHAGDTYSSFSSAFNHGEEPWTPTFDCARTSWTNFSMSPASTPPISALLSRTECHTYRARPQLCGKHAAERIAERVNGVRAIAEEIDVRLPEHKKTADDEIAGRVLKILAWGAAISDPEDITVKVEKASSRLRAPSIGISSALRPRIPSGY